MDKVKAFFKSASDFSEALRHEEKIFVYARGSEPSVEKFNQLIAQSESKESALSFASGAGAIAATLFSLLKSGDHVLFNRRCYSWARYLFTQHLTRFGVECTEVADADVSKLPTLFRPNTKLVYLESPTYFLFETLHLGELFGEAKSRGIITVIDNTYLGPGNLRPEFNHFDINLHSTTKIICGTGTALGGVVCTSRKLREKIFKDGLMSLGSVMHSGVAKQMSAGLESYPARAERIAKEMKPVVQLLSSDARVKAVHFPWTLNNQGNWSSHPQFKFPVGLLSLELKTDAKGAVEKFCNALKLVKMGVSYGSVEALIMPALIFAAKGSDLEFPPTICRLSIGEQRGIDVAADLSQALNTLN